MARTQSHNCECSLWEVLADGQTVDTGCARQTNKTFAPGHDAKLKALLLLAHRDSGQIRRRTGKNSQTYDTATAAAKQFGFYDQIQELIRRTEPRHAQPKQTKTPEREKSRPASVAVSFQPPRSRRPHKGTRHETIKIGRREYQATIGDDGTATYVDGNGNQQHRNSDEYRVLQKNPSAQAMKERQEYGF